VPGWIVDLGFGDQAALVEPAEGQDGAVGEDGGRVPGARAAERDGELGQKASGGLGCYTRGSGGANAA
jgi:hypothetical protein